MKTPRPLTYDISINLDEIADNIDDSLNNRDSAPAP